MMVIWYGKFLGDICYCLAINGKFVTDITPRQATDLINAGVDIIEGEF